MTRERTLPIWFRKATTSIAVLFDGADTPYTFLYILNSNQRAVYNTVKEKLFESSIDVALPSPLTWDGTSTSVPSNIKSALSEAVTGGLSALCDDYPMIF